MVQHAPPGYRFRRISKPAKLRVSRPERVLYDAPLFFVKCRQRGVKFRAACSFYCGLRGYAVGVATGDAAGIGTALASV